MCCQRLGICLFNFERRAATVAEIIYCPHCRTRLECLENDVLKFFFCYNDHIFSLLLLSEGQKLIVQVEYSDWYNLILTGDEETVVKNRKQFLR